jgi:hypothetical protein
MGVQQLLAFSSSRFKLGHLEVYGGFFMNTNGLKRLNYCLDVKLGVVEHSCAIKERGALLIGQKERFL